MKRNYSHAWICIWHKIFR